MNPHVRLGMVRSPLVSGGVIGVWPMMQDSADTSVLDVSGRGRHLALGGGLTTAEAWATAAWLSTVNASTDDTVPIPLAQWSDYSFNVGDSLLIALRFKAAAPASTETWLGQGYGTSNHGWRFVVKSTGVVAPWLDHAGGTKFLGDTTGVAADSAEHSLMFAWWNHDVRAATAKYMFWVDGARAYSAVQGATSLPTSIDPVDDLRIGGRKTGASSYDAMAAQFRGLHIYRAAANVPFSASEFDAIASRLWRSPFVPLSRSELRAEM